ncbi:hypothetical protein Tco_1501211 [Tanacetum coccineum]
MITMARDGLLPSFFLDINKRTHVSVRSTIATRIVIALMSFSMNVDQLAGMTLGPVSVGIRLPVSVVRLFVSAFRLFVSVESDYAARRPFCRRFNSFVARAFKSILKQGDVPAVGSHNNHTSNEFKSNVVAVGGGGGAAATGGGGVAATGVARMIGGDKW